MDLTAGRRKLHMSIVSDALSDLYPHDVNIYNEPPTNDMSLNEFEDIALERLQLFRIIEQANVKGHKINSDDWKACIKEDLSKAGLKKYVRLMCGYGSHTDLDHQARRADHISHFILRLAYCRSEELRRWFLNREMEWFRIRFSAQTAESTKLFLEINNFTYTPISTEVKEQLREDLIASTVGLSGYSFETTDFYKVPFTEVCSLVKNRRVFLKAGLAYIPAGELVVCLLSKFRTSLNETLNHYYRRLPELDDDRIQPLLANMHNIHTGNNYYTQRENKDSIDPAQLDAFSKKHYPLCMSHVHELLRVNHHLKHSCRLQYGLFLKAIGLLYDDAITFFRDEFTKKMDSAKFDKEHVYNIKHMYGKVGRMVNYAPYSCIKIILTNVGPGEHHGCPFKHWDPAVIKQKMIEYGLSGENANEIKELVGNGHFQVACGKYYEFTHGKAPNNGINHPNQYVEESVALEKEKSEAMQKPL